MSNHSPSTSPSPDAAPEAPFDWLLALLREAIVGLMAEDQPHVKKANALVRLGSLYLKTYHAAALERRNAELVEPVAELQERSRARRVETAAGEAEVAGPAETEPEVSPAPSRTESAKSTKSGPPGKHRPGGRCHGRPSPRKKAARRGGGNRGPGRRP